MENTSTGRPLDPTPPNPPGDSITAPELETDPADGRELPDNEDVTSGAGTPEPPD